MGWEKLGKLFRKAKESGAVGKADAYGTPSGYRNNYYYGRSGGAKWKAGLSASGSGVVLNHYALRQNARDAYHDSSQARALIDRYADSVADVGMQLEATPRASILGISDEEAENWANKVEASFDAWARSKNQNRAGTINFYQSQRLYQIFQHRDNDVFVRLFYSPSRKLMNPLQFDFIDPDQIQGYGFTYSYGYQASSSDGIIRNAKGEEIGYEIAVQDPRNPSDIKIQTIPAKGEKSGRTFMLHGFTPEYAGQGRGYSRLAHAIQDFENITDFSSSTIKKAINQAGIATFVKPGPDNPASNPFEGTMTNFGAGPVSQQYGSNPNPVENAENVELNDLYNLCDIPEATSKVPGSMAVVNLREGEELKPFDSTAPGQSFDQFVDAFTAYLASSMSMPIEVLLMRFNSNYSASRAALILFWRVAQIWRQEMASDYLNPVYEMWLNEEIASGRISAPGWNDPLLRAAWMSNRWIGAPMPNIDPQRTAAADRMYAEMGAQTLNNISRNLNGSSYEANSRKLTREYGELPTAPWIVGGG